MNGRIYDPKLGRMLQADPFIQSPTNSQSLNRYSYVLNNPLSYTDPSGYFVSELFNFARAVVRVFASEGFDVSAWADLVTSAIALINAFSGQAAAFIPGIAIGLVARSGVSLSMGQGSRQSSGEIEEAFRDPRMATLGGTISDLTGEKFGNGAMTRTFSYAGSVMAQRIGGAKGGGTGAGGNLPRGESRGLTAGELERAEAMFGDGMNWARVRIWNKKYPIHFGFQKDDMAISPNGGDIYFGPTAYMDDFSDSVGNMSFLVHELTHVWQVQNGFGLTFPPRGYDYAPVLARGGGWEQLTAEGQAEVVRDLYLRMNGYRPSYALPIGYNSETLRSLIPFSVPSYLP